MPILWRYLLKDYFRLLLLSIGAFVAILLVIRLEDIASFASLGANKGVIILFTCYQIPYILPLAIPIGSLIATWILLQRLSHSQEITALRAAGLSLKTITYPLLMAGVVLSLINFLMVSEVSSFSRLKSRELIYKMTTVNPLFLLQNEKLVKFKGSFVDMELLQTGKTAKDLLIISHSSSTGRLSAFAARKVSLEGSTLVGNKVAIISSFDSGLEGFDELIIENADRMHTEADCFSSFMQNTKWKVHEDYLPFKLLIAKTRFDHSLNKSSSGSGKIELARRLFLGMAPFTFTFIGISFAIHVGRGKNRKGLIYAALLALTFLFLFLTAKSFQKQPNVSVLLYLLPPPLMVLLSMRLSRAAHE